MIETDEQVPCPFIAEAGHETAKFLTVTRRPTTHVRDSKWKTLEIQTLPAFRPAFRDRECSKGGDAGNFCFAEVDFNQLRLRIIV